MSLLLAPLLYALIASLVCSAICCGALRVFAGPRDIKLYCCDTGAEYEPGSGCVCEERRA